MQVHPTTVFGKFDPHLGVAISIIILRNNTFLVKLNCSSFLHACPCHWLLSASLRSAFSLVILSHWLKAKTRTLRPPVEVEQPRKAPYSLKILFVLFYAKYKSLSTEYYSHQTNSKVVDNICSNGH